MKIQKKRIFFIDEDGILFLKFLVEDINMRIVFTDAEDGIPPVLQDNIDLQVGRVIVPDDRNFI
jgi:hypothetical protein